jgi:hypothetical protein
MFSFSAIAEAQSMDENQALSAKQQSIVPIAAFTANGDLQKLKTALNEGLDAGLAVNEIKEVLVQMYAYCGFPRSLNGISTFMSVMEEREKKGIKDELGKEPSLMPGHKSIIELGTEIQTRLVGRLVTGAIYTFVPVIDQFLKGHLFGDIFGRDNLDFQSREIATISALASMESVNFQLQSHFNVGFNVGLTEAHMRSLISVLEAKVGKKEADNAYEALNKVLSNRAKKEQADSMKIRLKVGDTVLTATLSDSATTRDFISLLPLTLTLEDYAGTEKISDLPKRLSTKNAPSGSDPSVGDITYYAPWGNLAIFYRDFGFSSGLVILGKIASGIEAFNVPGSLKVTIELIK